MELTHNFQRKGTKYISFMLDGVETFEEFHKRLQKLPKQVYATQPIYQEAWLEKKIKGDCFEWFGEAFLKILGNDSRIGIINYSPVPPHEDEGCDGIGIGMNLKPAAVQFKERGNHTEFLTNNDNHLGNFTTNAVFEHSVDVTTRSTDSNLTIITTAAGLHPYSSTHGPGQYCRVISWDHLTGMLSHHHIFWNEFKKLAGICTFSENVI